MKKIILILSCILLSTTFNDVFAKAKKHKKKATHGQHKKSKRHHGNGPDLKAITKESPYTENPTNGVTPVETNGVVK
jgi:hypothetical protein